VTARVRPRFVVHEPGGRRVVSVDRPVFRIGRAADAELQLSGPDVSREHAVLLTDSDGYLLRDLSRAGTFVNGQPVRECRLVHGDEIECGRGNAALMFVLTPPDGSREAVLQPADLRPLATLLASLRAMGGERVLDEVLAMVLDAAIDASGADRGFILLGDTSGRLEMQMARAADHAPLPISEAIISRKIPEQVFASGEAMVVADLLEGDFAAVHTGTVALGIRQVLCVPLRVVRYVERASAAGSLRSIGVLYLDSRSRGRLLTDAARQEIEALADEAAGAIENARLYEQALEKARIDRELETASRIQQALLPEPRRTGPFFEAVGASVASRAIGGDFFEYQDLPGDRFGVAIGDITGKGPPAALLTALVQGLLAGQAQSGDSPDAVVALVNRVLVARRIESRFVTMFLCALGPDGSFDYCNAGQTPPLLFSRGTVTRLETGGTLIGAFPEARFDRGAARLQPGDTIVLYSDGVSEAQNDEGEEFAEAGIQHAVEAALDGPPQAVLAALFAALRNFTSGSGDHDDMTAVVLRFRQP
jgi:serine phosphatase RsbU (regulator of sigma subunit)/pSer/pThr/pTyr-binding forkhead associated (FHA) protein